MKSSIFLISLNFTNRLLEKLSPLKYTQKFTFSAGGLNIPARANYELRKMKNV